MKNISKICNENITDVHIDETSGLSEESSAPARNSKNCLSKLLTLSCCSCTVNPIAISETIATIDPSKTTPF